MAKKTQFSKALIAMVSLALFATGCTKKRDAVLPEDAQESIFAISEFGDLQTEKTEYSVNTDDHLSALSLGDASRATAEKGVVAVTDLSVPSRLKYMFKGFEMNGQASHAYPVVFSVDKQFVTAYKVVDNASELSNLEKQLAQVKDEVVLAKELQKVKDNKKAKDLFTKLQTVRQQKSAMLTKNNAKLLVPIFKYKVASYGVLQRTKNDLQEETSTLRLKTTEWAEATHIQIGTTSGERLQVGIDPNSQGELNRTFVMNSINNKIMTAETLKSEYQVPVNMDAKARVLTLLDVDALHIYEIGQIGKTVLTDSQQAQLSSGAKDSNVRKCSDELVKNLPADAQQDCIIVLRYDVPVNYVRPELPTVDYDGNQANVLQFKTVRAGENVGLVQIAENVEPKKVEANNQMDPRTTIRVVDIKDKEFFFKRTLEDSPVTTPFAPGMAGALTIVKFELEEARLVVRKADKLVEYTKGSNSNDYEELMSLPVKYWKRDFKDASGASYSVARLVQASRQDAEYVELDWTKNTLPTEQSPYSAMSEGCIKGVGDQQVTDVDMRLDAGVLSFSYQYSLGLQPTLECVGLYNAADDYNGLASYQLNARMKERVSFKFNDGTTNQTFVGQVPFRAQNAMGFGVWTIGQIKPTDEGIRGRNGQEENYSVVQDFRNGKVLMYTLTGLPTDDAEIRKLYIDTTREIIDAWDLAYHNVFKGSKFERSGRYIEMQIAGENGVTAHVGDIDKNIIHFENKTNDNHGVLGVSQVGYNPRSGIVVADSLIVYAGNLKKFVATKQRNLGIAQKWDDMKAKFKEQAKETLAKQEKAAAEAKAPGASADVKAEAASQFARQLVGLTQGRKVDAKMLAAPKNIKMAAASVATAFQQAKALGADKFKYSSPNTESGWIDRVLKKVQSTENLDTLDIEALVSQEMLASMGSKLNDTEKSQLQRRVSLGAVRAKMKEQLKVNPGCLLAERDALGRDFTGKDFKKALRDILFFDLGHEMGHSQGLTHNFIGSFDKANFNNEDGSASQRNYSSIMDYMEPGQFHWDGIGTYDIHALRASHLGLLEANPQILDKLKAKNLVVQGKFITIDTVKSLVAKNGWTDVRKPQVAPLLKEFKYCTDIDVGYEPACQRFDFGTSAVELVENLIKDYEDNYVNSYHSWGRLNFNLSAQSAALSSSIDMMYQMRQFMDETMYRMVYQVGTQEEMMDYMQASFKAYLFYNQLLRSPDTTASFQDVANRFIAYPYQYRVVDKTGTPTGEVKTDVAIIEKRSADNIAIAKDRLDTVGNKYDKVIALELLSMKGYPSYKYASTGFAFSFLDFEKYVLQQSADQSIFVNTVKDIMLDQMDATFSNENAVLSPIRGERVTVTPELRLYAGVYGILNLESSTLRDKDNFANLFKVGSSIGKAPTDRLALSALGVSETSKTRLSYWALDNATAANDIMAIASRKNFMIQRQDVLGPLMAKLIQAQLTDMLAQGKKQADVAAAKAALIAKVNELNKGGMILSAEELKANPTMSIEGQVENMVKYNESVLGVAFGLLTEQQGAQEAGAQLRENSSQLAESFLLFAADQKSLVAVANAFGEAGSKTAGQEKLAQFGSIVNQLVDANSLDVSYGLIMKNVDFLNKLTLMTNPEYNR